MTLSFIRCLLVTTCLWMRILVMAHSPQQTVVIPADADTSLFETSPDNNLGASLSIPVGTMNSSKRSRALLHFNLASSIPSNSVIDSVELKIRVTASSSATPIDVSLHHLLKPWGEGSKTSNQGALASTNESTWNARYYPAQLWSAPGGASNLDFVGVSSSSITLGGTNDYVFGATPDMISDVQSWVFDSGSNFGWIMISESESASQTARRFLSRENAIGAPTLTVVYHLIDGAKPIEEVDYVNGLLAIHLSLSPQNEYRLEGSDVLGTTNWNTITTFAPATTYRHIVSSETVGSRAMRFYRLAITPKNP